ncbi:MAG: autotransporter-associated beta strand repeat-containing protein [Verrucomicrobiota bacterium]
MKPSAFTRLARTGSPAAWVLATAIAILLAQPSAQAANTYTFTPTSAGINDWTSTGNWAASGVPVSANDATVAFFPDITTAVTGAVTINTDPATLTLNTLTLNGLAPANATVNTTTTTAVAIGTAGQAWTVDGTTPTVNINAPTNGTQTATSGASVLNYTLKPNIALNQPLTFAGVGTAGLTLSGVISESSGMGIINNSKRSKITLNGSTVNTFTGGVTINGGNTGYNPALAMGGTTLLLDFANLGATGTDLINSGNALTLGGGTLALQGKGSATDSQTFATTTLSANTGSRITLTQNSATSLSVDLKAITRNAGSTLIFSAQPATAGIIAKTSNSNTNGILGTWAVGGYSNTAPGAYYQTVNGSGQIVSFGAGTTSTSPSNLSDVQDPTGNYNVDAKTKPVTLTGNITANTIRLPGGSTSTLALGNYSVTLNGILMCGGANNITSSGTGTVKIGADNELVVWSVNSAGKTVNIGVPIVNGTAGNSAVTIAGLNADANNITSEQVTFSGSAPNTYTGPTTVNSATLYLNKSANVVAVPGDLNVTGGTVWLGAANQIASTANLTFSGKGQFADQFQSNYGLRQAQTVASVTVSGNQGGFYIAIGGTLTVSGALSITGNNGAGPLGNGTTFTGTVPAYGMDSTATMTVGSLSLDNSFFYVGEASANTPTLTLKGDFTGANTSSLNTSATAPKFVLFGTDTHNHNFNITSGTTTIAPPISETATTTASLTKTGTGTLVLTGTNTYSGDTTVTGGILAVNGSSIKDSNKLIISGGKVQPTGTEGVDTLFFGTAQQAAGTWGATGSGATHIDNTHFAGTGVVSVTSGPVGPVGGYDAWAATNAGSEAANLDFDKDGVPNGVEYFMGIGPTDPVFTPTPAVVNGKITWPHSATATDITYRVLTSENLTSWSDVTAQTTDAGGFLEYILPKTSPELFVRLEVVAP